MSSNSEDFGSQKEVLEVMSSDIEDVSMCGGISEVMSSDVEYFASGEEMSSDVENDESREEVLEVRRNDVENVESCEVLEIRDSDMERDSSSEEVSEVMSSDIEDVASCKEVKEKKRSFENEIESFFDSWIKSSNREQLFSDTVTEFIEIHAEVLKCPFALRIFCRYLLKFLCAFDCGDVTLITKILAVFFSIEKLYRDWDDCEYDECESDGYYHHYLGEEKLHSDLHTGWYDETVPEYTKWPREMFVTTTNIAFEEDDITVLQFLAQYGIIAFEPDITSCYVLATRLWNSRNSLFHFKLTAGEDYELFEKRNALLDDHITKINENESNKSEAIRRFVLLLKAIITMIKYRPPISDVSQTSCLNIVYDTIYDTYFTISDVTNFADKFFFEPNYDFTLENVREGLKHLFPEIHKQPDDHVGIRQLQHLCRLKIRESLTGTETLPKAVSKLPIKLKNYLLCKEFRTVSEKGHSSNSELLDRDIDLEKVLRLSIN